mmetsp:Transcript_28480/g.83822  ORF Transcript_28480/g.83822 Transcript_28480/m.83822 type:complete len:295 (-) Transcript_28480:353-1237(-)
MEEIVNTFISSIHDGTQVCIENIVGHFDDYKMLPVFATESSSATTTPTMDGRKTTVPVPESVFEQKLRRLFLRMPLLGSIFHDPDPKAHVVAQIFQPIFHVGVKLLQRSDHFGVLLACPLSNALLHVRNEFFQSSEQFRARRSYRHNLRLEVLQIVRRRVHILRAQLHHRPPEGFVDVFHELLQRTGGLLDSDDLNLAEGAELVLDGPRGANELVVRRGSNVAVGGALQQFGAHRFDGIAKPIAKISSRCGQIVQSILFQPAQRSRHGVPLLVPFTQNVRFFRRRRGVVSPGRR